MKYVVQQRENPRNPEQQQKYYLIAKTLGRVGLHELSKEIALATSLTRGDVVNTIESFLDCIPKYLMMGYSIRIDEFGTFSLTLSSEGAETAKDAKPSNVKHIRIAFRPSPVLRRLISDAPIEEFPKSK